MDPYYVTGLNIPNLHGLIKKDHLLSTMMFLDRLLKDVSIEHFESPSKSLCFKTLTGCGSLIECYFMIQFFLQLINLNQTHLAGFF